MRKPYSKEQKQQIVLEAKTVGHVPSVAKKYDVPQSTIHTWLQRDRETNNTTVKALDKAKENKRLKQQLEKQSTEIAILKDLLKKTYAVWPND